MSVTILGPVGKGVDAIRRLSPRFVKRTRSETMTIRSDADPLVSNSPRTSGGTLHVPGRLAGGLAGPGANRIRSKSWDAALTVHRDSDPMKPPRDFRDHAKTICQNSPSVKKRLFKAPKSPPMLTYCVHCKLMEEYRARSLIEEEVDLSLSQIPAILAASSITTVASPKMGTAMRSVVNTIMAYPVRKGSLPDANMIRKTKARAKVILPYNRPSKPLIVVQRPSGPCEDSSSSDPECEQEGSSSHSSSSRTRVSADSTSSEQGSSVGSDTSDAELLPAITVVTCSPPSSPPKSGVDCGFDKSELSSGNRIPTFDISVPSSSSEDDRRPSFSLISRRNRLQRESDATLTLSCLPSSDNETITPPPSPRPQATSVSSVSSGHVDCSCFAYAFRSCSPPKGDHSPSPAFTPIALQTINTTIRPSSLIDTPSMTVSIAAEISTTSEAYSSFLGLPSVPKPRACSVDLPSILHDIERCSTDSEDDRARSRSLDLSPVQERATSPAAKASGFSSWIRRAIAKRPARMEATLQLFDQKDRQKELTKYWGENTTPDCHIWIESNSTSDCYVKEAYCVKTGERRKCAACHIVIHTGCLGELNKMKFTCKPTYREALNKFQKEQYPPVQHHWVHKRRQDGRCKECGKPFQQKLFGNKEIVAVSCSWCKEAYHNKHECFTMALIEGACTMGPFQEVVVPPSWILKFPARKSSTIRKQSMPEGSKRRRRSKKALRLFSVRPPPEPYEGTPTPRCPLLVFVNPKSGGNKGMKILLTMSWLLNPRQVFDINVLNNPRYGLEMFRKVPNLRILICGGDGTVGWVLSTLDSLKWPAFPPIGILPLGTGNDLARTLGWGGSYTGEPMSKLLNAIVNDAVVTQLDRWIIDVEPNLQAGTEKDDERGSQSLALTVMNNYFSLGQDAQVALQFHETRAANPDIFNKRYKNRFMYAVHGTHGLVTRPWRDLSEHLTLECDGVNLTHKIKELKLHCLLFLNIPRYAGGTLPWGTVAVGQGGLLHPPSYSDKRIEVIGFPWTGLATIHAGSHGERIAQCSLVRIITRKTIPAQVPDAYPDTSVTVDGEPSRLAPSKITVKFHRQVPMLQRISRSRSSSRRGSHVPVISTDPSSFSQQVSLYQTVLLPLRVNCVSKDDYENFCNHTAALIQRVVHLGTISVEPEQELDQTRQLINKEAQKKNVKLGTTTAHWSFVDYTRYEDRVQRVDISKEHEMLVSDVCNTEEYILIVDPALPPQVVEC